MKKLLVLLLALLMVVSLTGCSSKEKGATVESNEEVVSKEENGKSEEEQLAQDMAELSAIGDIEVENGLLTVSITVPADFSEGESQDSLDSRAGDEYVSAKLNDDGSITYKFTKKQYRDMMDELTRSFEQGFAEMVDDNNYAFASIEHNSDFTEFDVKLDGEELGLAESFAAYALFMYSGLYGVFNGKMPESVVVNYYGVSGNLLDTVNSADLSK